MLSDLSRESCLHCLGALPGTPDTRAGISTKIEQMKFQINYRARSSLINAITDLD